MAYRKECVIARIKRVAKTGRREVKLSLYPEEISWLKEEGFEVKEPKRRVRDLVSGKTRYEVTVGWKNATTGIARRMKNLVASYAYQCTSKTRDNISSKCKKVKGVYCYSEVDDDYDDGYDDDDEDDPDDDEYYDDEQCNAEKYGSEDWYEDYWND